MYSISVTTLPTTQRHDTTQRHHKDTPQGHNGPALLRLSVRNQRLMDDGSGDLEEQLSRGFSLAFSCISSLPVMSVLFCG